MSLHGTWCLVMGFRLLCTTFKNRFMQFWVHITQSISTTGPCPSEQWISSLLVISLTFFVEICSTSMYDQYTICELPYCIQLYSEVKKIFLFEISVESIDRESKNSRFDSDSRFHSAGRFVNGRRDLKKIKNRKMSKSKSLMSLITSCESDPR